MALDGITVAALTEEINLRLTNLRIDKIYQPEHDEIHLTFRGPGESHRLLLTANPNVVRACFTGQAKSNPAVPPMFCMLLRKHLQGGRFTGAHQPGFERIIQIGIESYNELGDLTQKQLIIEMMGRHSNIILAGPDMRVIDAIKHVDFSVSSVRQVLPGLPYEQPPSQAKKNPLSLGIGDFMDDLSAAQEGTKSDRFFVDAYTGVSPIIGREISFRALGDTCLPIGGLDYAARLDLATAAFRLFEQVAQKTFGPCIIEDSQTGKPIDFAALPIAQYGGGAQVHSFESMSDTVENFYYERDRRERMAHRSASLARLLSNNIERCAKKIILQRKELGDTKNRDKYKRYGDLLTANLYRLEPGMKRVEVEDYFDLEATPVSIPLDETLTPAQNAQRYYTKYNKAKTAETEITHQLALATEELDYLESVEEALSLATSETELEELRAELTEQGYIRRSQDGKKKKQALSQPLAFTTSDGFRVLVGRNNKQNEQLTLKTARNNDLWFHTKGFHGSHAILKYEYEKSFPNRSVEEAAMLAAYFSKARSAANVPVDYTEVRNVRKPAGARPGMVIYERYQTAYVTPREELVKRLAQNTPQ